MGAREIPGELIAFAPAPPGWRVQFIDRQDKGRVDYAVAGWVTRLREGQTDVVAAVAWNEGQLITVDSPLLRDLGVECVAGPGEELE